MQASVDQQTCIGCGICPHICPEVFSMNDDGKAEAQEKEVEVTLYGCAAEARDNCPVNAIDLN